MADDKEKVYYPEEIDDQPFPQALGDGDYGETQKTSSGVYNPEEIPEQKFPIKRTAVELLSTALNTKSKKILKEFNFAASGAIQVGTLDLGVSGDLRFSPAGILARNSSGITTFGIDGEAGDAIFAGELRTGSIITGTVIVTDGNIALYNNGILEIFLGDDGT